MKMTIIGKKSFTSYRLMCDRCGYEEDRLLDCRPYDTEDEAFEATDLKCPGCDEGMLHRTFHGCAPSVKVKDQNREISSMKQSFQERFVKSGEMDQCRHRFGVNFDDSLRSAAAQRVKRGQE